MDLYKGGTTIIHKIFETNSSLHCEMAHYERSLISVFQEFFAGIDKIFFLAGKNFHSSIFIRGTNLYFYEVLRLS